jgi:subtilase family protein
MRAKILILILLFCISSVSATLVDSGVVNTLSNEGSARVIVSYDGNVPLPNNVIDDPTLKVFYGDISQKDILDLSNNPEVNSIQLDWQLQIKRADGALIINSDTINLLSVNTTNIIGGAHSICILDTGLDYGHDEFGNCTTEEFRSGNCTKVAYGFDYVNNDDDPIDDEGHGTHVAGIVNQVSPGVKFIIMKVCDEDGDCYVSDMATAVSWCTTFKDLYNISAISLSIGDSGAWIDDECFSSDPLSVAISNAYDAGIFVGIASGNEGYTTGINYPGCSKGATSVGSSTKTDLMSYFTNQYETLDVLAPGSNIMSTYLSDTETQKSGTSMATPFVSASAILIKQYHQLHDNITLTPQEIEYKLKNSNFTINSYPRIDLNSSINAGGECYINTDCGDDIWYNSPICSNNSIYQNKTIYTCNFGYCENSTNITLKETCTNGCSEATCITVSSSSSGSGGGSLKSNIDKIEIISNQDWAINSQVKIQANIYNKANNLYEVDQVKAYIIYEAGDKVLIGVLTEFEKGIYEFDYENNLPLGNYTLEIVANEGYTSESAELNIRNVKLSGILNIKKVASNISIPEITWIRMITNFLSTQWNSAAF